MVSMETTTNLYFIFILRNAYGHHTTIEGFHCTYVLYIVLKLTIVRIIIQDEPNVPFSLLRGTKKLGTTLIGTMRLIAVSHVLYTLP